MLKINNNFKKYRIPLISAFVVIGGMFLFSYLTYIPTQTFATDEGLIVDPHEKRNLSDISTMQEMSQQVCINSKENETKQLFDARDTKKYWVTKLKDGNCWMTQNLDFDIPSVLSASTTDIENDANLNVEKYTNSTGIGTWEAGTERIKYYDPGLVVKINPLENTYCRTTTNLLISDCLNAGWRDVADKMPNNTEMNGVVIDGNLYDAHYLVGNYYSWNAATAGTGAEAGFMQGNQSTGSICPKGWTLPSSEQYESSNGSFAHLFQHYGLTLTNNMSSALLNGYSAYGAPFYLLRSGHVDNGNYIGGAGTSGIYWGNTIIDTGGRIYSLYSSENNISPANGNYYAIYGVSVRCVATGGWLASYDKPLDSNQANVAITVSPVISIDATSGMSESIDFTQVAEGNITAKVSSNQAYQVLLSTEQSNLEQNPVLANFNIPMVTNDTKITAGVNSWGVKKTLSVAAGGTAGDDTTLTNTLYSPIGIGDDKVLFYKSSGAESKTLVFPVAISVDATLPSGIYSTQVTITAVAN